jgi:hypothetical protein
MSKITEHCQNPESLKRRPGKCSPEQIKKCHGNENDHPCIDEKKKPARKD